MTATLSAEFSRSFRKAPQRVQKDFGKQLGFLLSNVNHPSLRAKKYEEKLGVWQARVNDDWRFYFRIEGDVYRLDDITPHPK